MKEIKDNFNKEDLNDINKAGFPVWYEKKIVNLKMYIMILNLHIIF